MNACVDRVMAEIEWNKKVIFNMDVQALHYTTAP